MTRSYFQKVATYSAYMKAHPEVSSNAIYEHYREKVNGKNNPNGMRKTDFFKAIAPLREVAAFDARNKNSDMKPATREKLHKAAYRYSRTQTERGRKEYRKGLSKAQKAKYDEVGIHATVEDLERRVYKKHPEKGVYVEFYPLSEFYAPPVDSDVKK